MTETQIVAPPSFDYSAPVTLTNAEAKKLLEGDRLNAYQDYELEILGIEWKGQNQKDNTWGMFNIIFGLPGCKLNADNRAVTADGQQSSALYHNLMLPMTSKQFFNEEKKPIMLVRLIGFLAAIGVQADLENLSVLKQVFSDYSKLKGKKVKAYIGFTKDHIAYKDGSFYIADKKGKPYEFAGNRFDSKDRADGEATRKGFTELQSRMGVIKFYPSEVTPAEAPKAVVDADEY